MVNGPSPGPAPAAQAPQLPAHPIQLADVAPPEAAQESSQGGWRLDYAADGATCPAGRNTSASSMKSPPASAEATRVSHPVRPPRRVSQVDVAVDDFTQAQVLG